MDTIYNISRKYGDPRVLQWPLMDGPGPTVFIACVYLLLVYWIMPAYMKNRKPYDITAVIKAYNISQILINIFLLYNFLSGGWIQGAYSLGCQDIDYSNHPYAVQNLKTFYYIYLLKLYELIETMFFCLRKKNNQASPLHVYHHASSCLLAYPLCKFYGGGMFAVPPMMNIVIHIFMYIYYYLSSLSPEWQKKLAPWKQRLTFAQMVQFTLMLLHATTGLQPGCNIPKTYFVLYVPNIVVIFKMFYDFYRNSYCQKNSGNSKQEK